MRLRDVRQGDRFFEEDHLGRRVLMEALETAHEVNDAKRGLHGHECRARVICGDACMADEQGLLTLFERYEPYGYGLHLYPAK
jgi:hypothetical protein